MRDTTPQIQLSMIELMRGAGLSDSIARTIAQLIATNARFNSWCSARKKGATEDELLNILERDEELCELCQAAVRDFNVDGDENRLQHVLSDVINELNKIMMT